MPHSSDTANAAPRERVLTTVPLRDLDVAPDNARFGEAPDDEIPQLAATILAAGILQPLTVRPGRRKERPAMVLDGRRRLLALRILLDDGAIAEDYPVPAFEETDPARQAAAVLLTNTAAPVHIADVITSIGKMLKAKLTPEVIAGALGYAEIEVRRLAALSGLHAKAIEALKAGKITLRQARLLARLPDKKIHAELAQAAFDGFGFQEWRITERLDAGQVTVADRRFALVGPDRYAAAGGRSEADLFGERAAVLLDPDVLQAAWTVRAEAIAASLAAEGLEVRVAVAPGDIEDETLEPFGYAYGLGLDDDALNVWRTAQGVARDAQAALALVGLSSDEATAMIAGFLRARLAADQAAEPTRPVTFVQVFANVGTGLEITAYGPPAEVVEDEEPEAEDGEDADAGAHERPGPALVSARTPVAAAAAPATDGVGHGLHEVRTDMATRVLIRALADDPAAALIVLTARLFDVLVRRHGLGRGGGALALGAEAYSRMGRAPVPTLDGQVRERLAARRADWEVSGKSSLGWVADLEPDVRLALLAEVVALSLDLREERTTSLRRNARAEAAEIAALCDAEASRWWTPDDAYLRAHSKPQLLTMLADMGAGDPRDGGRRKDELVGLVARSAEDRSWAPPDLSWRAAEEPVEAPDETPPWEGEADFPEAGGGPREGEGDAGEPLAA